MINYLHFLFKDKKSYGYIKYFSDKLVVKISNKTVDKTLFYLENYQKDQLSTFTKKYYYLTSRGDRKLSTKDDFYNIFESHYIWTMNPFKEIDFIISYDSVNIFPMLIRQTSPNILFIYIATTSESLEFINEFYKEIDFLIYHKRLENSINKELRAKISFQEQNELFDTIKSYQKAISSKSKDFIEIYSRSNIQLDLKKYQNNFLDLDGFFVISKNLQSKSLTFREMLEELEDKLIAIYLKEEIYIRYKTICTEKTLKEFLIYSLEDGVRYEYITY